MHLLKKLLLPSSSSVTTFLLRLWLLRSQDMNHPMNKKHLFSFGNMRMFHQNILLLYKFLACQL